MMARCAPPYARASALLQPSLSAIAGHTIPLCVSAPATSATPATPAAPTTPAAPCQVVVEQDAGQNLLRDMGQTLCEADGVFTKVELSFEHGELTVLTDFSPLGWQMFQTLKSKFFGVGGSLS
jgi:hypothetical protein